MAGGGHPAPAFDLPGQVEMVDGGGALVGTPVVAEQHPHQLELVAVGIGAIDALGGTVAGLAGIGSLQLKLVVSGNAAQKVADTLGPSPLQDLLTSTFPTPVPTAWRIVTFDGFQAKVPATWPTHHIVIKSG